MFRPNIPDWAESHWDPGECTVIRQTDGKWCIIEHNLQIHIGFGDSKEDCLDWLNTITFTTSDGSERSITLPRERDKDESLFIDLM